MDCNIVFSSKISKRDALPRDEKVASSSARAEERLVQEIFGNRYTRDFPLQDGDVLELS